MRYVIAELTHQLQMLCTYDFMVSSFVTKWSLQSSQTSSFHVSLQILHRCLKLYFPWK